MKDLQPRYDQLVRWSKGQALIEQCSLGAEKQLIERLARAKGGK
jgi:hypothetical protein